MIYNPHASHLAPESFQHSVREAILVTLRFQISQELLRRIFQLYKDR